MKITINEKPEIDEVDIIINCKAADEQVLKILSSLRTFDRTITGTKNAQTYLLSPDLILYIESVDKKTFIYCEKEVYESPLRLYELEERLLNDGFFRASKSTVINLSQVHSLIPDFGGRILLIMNNGEKSVVSRQYATNVKKKLGI